MPSLSCGNTSFSFFEEKKKRRRGKGRGGEVVLSRVRAAVSLLTLGNKTSGEFDLEAVRFKDR